MVKHDIGRLPVIQDGKIIGIISRSDAMRYFYDVLPD
jgi:CBS domain-containing protein